jgi:uncharacterized membrane protein
VPGTVSSQLNNGDAMRKLLTFTAMAALVLSGCNHSPEGGTPGTSSSFTISAPTLSTTIKQDNKESIKLTVNRGSDFKKTITLTAVAPEKLKAELSKSTIAPSDPNDLMLNVSVAKDASLGDATIRVTGTPEGGGASTSVEVKIKVEKNP